MAVTRTLLTVARAGIGLGAWFAPDLTVRVFGLENERSQRFVGRLFGARELALAVGLGAAPAPALRTVALAGAAIDAVDTVAGFDEARRGNLSTRAIVLGPLGALLFTVMGVLIAREAADADAR